VEGGGCTVATTNSDNAPNKRPRKEMKDLCRTKFCLGLQLEHLHTGIHVQQSTYI
jgi:hypothetical protein